MKDRSKNKKSLTKPIFISVLFIFFLSISLLFVVSQANAADQWVSDPATCNINDATNFPGQNCSPVNICGDSSGIAQCYDTSVLLPPAVIATSNLLYSSSYPNGGYIANCYATKDSAEPFCDNNTNYWCNRSTNCYTTERRDTVCTASTWAASTCGSCRTGYADCDAGGDSCEIQFGVTNYPTGANNNYADCTTAQCDTNWTDCNASGIDAGDGCEIQEGATCTVGALTGTWSGCTCLVGKQYFETGTEAGYATTDPLLWGVQHGSGDLIHFGNGTDPDLFIVNNDGAVQLGQIVAPGTTTDRLYNVAGDLYWNGAAVGAGAGGDSIYSADGTLASNRIVETGAFELDFTSTGDVDGTVKIGNSDTLLHVKANRNFAAPIVAKFENDYTISADVGIELQTTLNGVAQQRATFSVAGAGLTFQSRDVVAGTKNPISFDNRVVIDDNGIEYDIDYAPLNLTNDRWVPDKAYVDSVAGSGGGSITAINFSTVSTDGAFSSGGLIGYEAANDICSAEFAGSHFCRTDEIIQYIELFTSAGFTGTAWIAEGPPGYTSNSNDCNGWTDNDDAKLGAFWQFLTPGGGMGWLTNCEVSKQLACCE